MYKHTRTISEVGGVSPTGKSYSFRSCVRACERAGEARRSCVRARGDVASVAGFPDRE